MDNQRDVEIGTQRLETLTDGVFAIVMTLLALELSLPIISQRSLDIQLIPRLIELWPKFYSYILSFLLTGMLWNGNRVEYRYIKRSDGMLVMLTVIYLMFLTLLPFTTSVVGAYPLDKLPLLIFGINFAAILCSRIVIWRYAVGEHRLVDPDLSPQLIRTNTLIPLVAILGAFINSLIAFVSPLAAIIIYYVLVLFYLMVIVKGAFPGLGIRREK